MAWKTTVVWDLNNQVINDLRDGVYIGLVEKYNDHFVGNSIGSAVKTIIEDVNHIKVERLWKDEESARFFINTIIKYLVDEGITPVTTAVEFVPD